MNGAEAAALVTYASQIDDRVQVTPANVETWADALGAMAFEDAKWLIREHYGRAGLDGARPVPVGPGLLRRASQTSETVEDARVAARALPPSRVVRQSLRQRDPAQWDALVQGGAVKRLEKLESTGELDDDDAARLARFRETGVLPRLRHPDLRRV